MPVQTPAKIVHNAAQNEMSVPGKPWSSGSIKRCRGTKRRVTRGLRTFDCSNTASCVFKPAPGEQKRIKRVGITARVTYFRRTCAGRWAVAAGIDLSRSDVQILRFWDPDNNGRLSSPTPIRMFTTLGVHF